MVVPPLRALGLTLLLVVTGPGARRDPEARAQEGMNPHHSAPGEKRPSPEPAPQTKNLLVHLLLASRIPILLPGETQWAHRGPGIPGTHMATEALEEVGIPEVTIGTTKTDEESAPHLGNGAAVAVIALLKTMIGTATTVPAPLTVDEDKEHI